MRPQFARGARLRARAAHGSAQPDHHASAAVRLGDPARSWRSRKLAGLRSWLHARARALLCRHGDPDGERRRPLMAALCLRLGSARGPPVRPAFQPSAPPPSPHRLKRRAARRASMISTGSLAWRSRAPAAKRTASSREHARAERRFSSLGTAHHDAFPAITLCLLMSPTSPSRTAGTTTRTKTAGGGRRDRNGATGRADRGGLELVATIAERKLRIYLDKLRATSRSTGRRLPYLPTISRPERQRHGRRDLRTPGAVGGRARSEGAEVPITPVDAKTELEGKMDIAGVLQRRPAGCGPLDHPAGRAADVIAPGRAGCSVSCSPSHLAGRGPRRSSVRCPSRLDVYAERVHAHEGDDHVHDENPSRPLMAGEAPRRLAGRRRVRTEAFAAASARAHRRGKARSPQASS